MMKTQIVTVVLSCLSIARIAADTHQDLRHTHPYYVQTFPIHSSPQLSHQAPWSQAPAFSSGRSQQTFGSPQHLPNFQYNGGAFAKPPAPIAYQTITITDYTGNGTRENRLTSRMSSPVDLTKLLQSFEQTAKKPAIPMQSRWNSFYKIPDTFFYNTYGSDGSSYNFGGSQGVHKFGQYPFGGFSTPSPVVHHHVQSPSTTEYSFEFPSSDDLNNVWGNKLDDANEEKNEDRRSTNPRQTKKFVQAALDVHNGYRKKHKAAALSYNQQVAKVAQAWANKLIISIARGGHLEHRPNNKYGENLWMGSGYKFSDEEAVRFAVKSWYDEIGLYKQYWGREPDMSNFMKWGHFTQVVWKGSSKLGMGISRKNGYIVVVANYDPPGNYRGSFAKNVKRP